MNERHGHGYGAPYGYGLGEGIGNGYGYGDGAGETVRGGDGAGWGPGWEPWPGCGFSAWESHYGSGDAEGGECAEGDEYPERDDARVRL